MKTIIKYLMLSLPALLMSASFALCNSSNDEEKILTVPSGVSSYNVGSIYSYEKYALSDPTYGYSVKSIELF